jgi:hypothetical protein
MTHNDPREAASPAAPRVNGLRASAFAALAMLLAGNELLPGQSRPGPAPPVPPRAGALVFGIWSTGDLFLTEAQMVNSQRYVNAPWRYQRIEGANN